MEHVEPFITQDVVALDSPSPYLGGSPLFNLDTDNAIDFGPLDDFTVVNTAWNDWANALPGSTGSSDSFFNEETSELFCASLFASESLPITA